MTKLPKRALLAATLATALVGVSATALVQASGLQSVSAGVAPTITVVAQADTPPAANKPAPKPERLTPEQRDQKRIERTAQMQKKMAERQAAFKAELKIKPAQEPAWNAFVARTQPQARPAQQGAREDWSRLTTPQRLDKMQALKTQRDAAFAKRSDAIKSFYAALDADQQKTFDAKRMPGFQRAGMRGDHGGKHHRGDHRQHGDNGFSHQMGATT
ncbi:Spy/CpxP family protein refolding chaperone [Hydrogenophaga sp.]|uniref:Spy/CpxP family protein refolding chaperone n=1 Tax=Hydrogenophaga sp. TaxID=1904254 RepID=UPI00271D0820|nr:Spy/CpxP family protein refolding chaperone [Hydrogenophaga sp.]MDO9435660.1 Spy/CpxP family protein refolding chaperone [Hydrogenophaga sp.]